MSSFGHGSHRTAQTAREYGPLQWRVRGPLRASTCTSGSTGTRRARRARARAARGGPRRPARDREHGCRRRARSPTELGVGRNTVADAYAPARRRGMARRHVTGPARGSPTRPDAEAAGPPATSTGRAGAPRFDLRPGVARCRRVPPQQLARRGPAGARGRARCGARLRRPPRAAAAARRARRLPRPRPRRRTRPGAHRRLRRLRSGAGAARRSAAAAAARPPSRSRPTATGSTATIVEPSGLRLLNVAAVDDRRRGRRRARRRRRRAAHARRTSSRSASRSTPRAGGRRPVGRRHRRPPHRGRLRRRVPLRPPAGGRDAGARARPRRLRGHRGEEPRPGSAARLARRARPLARRGRRDQATRRASSERARSAHARRVPDRQRWLRPARPPRAAWPTGAAATGSSSMLAGHAPGIEVSGIAAGLHALVHLPDEDEAERRSPAPPSTDSGGAASPTSPRLGTSRGAALVVGYATPPDHAYTATLRRLDTVLSRQRAPMSATVAR